MKTTKISGVLSFLLLSLLGGVLISCDRQEYELLSEPDHNLKVQSDLLSEKDAATQALNIYTMLFYEKLRSADIPQVLSVQKARSLRTSGGDGNEGVFVVNFKDNRGYVVLSESLYNEPIISASESGNLDINVPTENMNLIPVLSNTDAILEYNHKQKAVADLVDIDGNPIPAPSIEQYRYDFGPWETLSQSDPLVQVEWDQWSPHNRKLQTIDGKYPPVGCVATAISQIMSFHRYPNYDWDKIVANKYDAYSADILSTLHRDLGSPQNLDMEYSLDGSSARSSNVPRTLRAYGYQSSDLCDYDWGAIKSEIFDQRPVYIRASTYKHVTKTPRFLFWGGKTKVSYSGGHAWVLDGFKCVRRKVTQIDKLTGDIVSVSYQEKELVHCNFGWGRNQGNGYYLSKAFDTNKGPEMRSTLREDDETYGQEYNFQYNHRIIKDIKRK